MLKESRTKSKDKFELKDSIEHFSISRRCMKDLTTMPNIGKETASKLKSVKINTAEDLVEIGAKEAFIRLKIKYPQVCLVHLYALEGAIKNIEFNCLSEKTKTNLKEFGDSLK